MSKPCTSQILYFPILHFFGKNKIIRGTHASRYHFMGTKNDFTTKFITYCIEGREKANRFNISISCIKKYSGAKKHKKLQQKYMHI